MWVVRPISDPEDPEVDDESGAQRQVARFGLPEHQRAIADESLTVSGITSTETILCRICERHFPAWFFEKHNDTCSETHRLENDISECNDRLVELTRVVHAIGEALQDQQPPSSPIDVRTVLKTGRRAS